MATDFTKADADRHNALYAKGWALTEGRLILHEQATPGRPGWYVRWRPRRAARCFERALGINSDGW